MIDFQVIITSPAQTDLKDACKWYNSQQKGLGRRLREDMKKALLKIARNPKSFAIRYKGIRLANFEKFPYAAHFIINEEKQNVKIIAVLHVKRKPGISADRF